MVAGMTTPVAVHLGASFALCATTAKYIIGERGSSWEIISKFATHSGLTPGIGI